MRHLLLFATLCIATSGFANQSASPEKISAAAIIHEINLARQNPAQYASYIEEMRSHYIGNFYKTAGNIPIRTHEGVRALEEAIAFLRRAPSQPPLALSAGLCEAAADHCRDQVSGAVGHRGSDRSNPGDRMNRHGQRSCAWGENITYGRRSARDVVTSFIIDDGVRNRGHRKNIFNSDYKFAGAAFGPHTKFGTVCSVDFVREYTEAGLVNVGNSTGCAF